MANFFFVDGSIDRREVRPQSHRGAAAQAHARSSSARCRSISRSRSSAATASACWRCSPIRTARIAGGSSSRCCRSTTSRCTCSCIPVIRPDIADHSRAVWCSPGPRQGLARAGRGGEAEGARRRRELRQSGGQGARARPLAARHAARRRCSSPMASARAAACSSASCAPSWTRSPRSRPARSSSGFHEQPFVRRGAAAIAAASGLRATRPLRSSACDANPEKTSSARAVAASRWAASGMHGGENPGMERHQHPAVRSVHERPHGRQQLVFAALDVQLDEQRAPGPIRAASASGVIVSAIHVAAPGAMSTLDMLSPGLRRAPNVTRPSAACTARARTSMRWASAGLTARLRRSWSRATGSASSAMTRAPRAAA